MADYDDKAREIARRYETNPVSDRITLSRQIAAALREAVKAERERCAGWQPIETAPKDGTPVMLWYGWWYLGRYYDDPGQWSDTDDILDERPEEIAQRGGTYANAIYPTRWMPLPSPPLSENPDGQ